MSVGSCDNLRMLTNADVNFLSVIDRENFFNTDFVPADYFWNSQSNDLLKGNKLPSRGNDKRTY